MEWNGIIFIPFSSSDSSHLFLNCSLSHSEVLFETASFPDRKLAALVASKVYFHLGEFDEALSFALGSAELFDVDKKDEYVDTVVCEYRIRRERQA